MSRFPKIPGAGAKSIGNPIYWSRRYLQDQIYQNKRKLAVERFNEKWSRLCNIREILILHYDSYIEDGRINISVEDTDASIKKAVEAVQKISNVRNQLDDLHSFINQNISDATNSDLSKYATLIKKYAIMTVSFLIQYERSEYKIIQYDSKNKIILIDGEEYFYLG